MKTQKLTFLLAGMLVLLFTLTAGAQTEQTDSYIRKGSIGKKNEAADKDDSAYRDVPIEEWQGLQFVFMPKLKAIQSYGYQGFARLEFDRNGKRKAAHIPAQGLSYEKYVGRIAKVIGIQKGAGSTADKIQAIDFVFEDNGEAVTYKPTFSMIEGLAPAWIVNHARKQFLQKNLWLIDSILQTLDETTGRKSAITVKRFSPVKVVDIVVSDNQDASTRFILETKNGDQGFLDVSLSLTNARPSLAESNRFYDKFLIADPRETSKWSESVWELIENRKVVIGMTEEQVFLSRGRPTSTGIITTETGSTKTWTYGRTRVLHFSNGKLVLIQE